MHEHLSAYNFHPYMTYNDTRSTDQKRRQLLIKTLISYQIHYKRRKNLYRELDFHLTSENRFQRRFI